MVSSRGPAFGEEPSMIVHDIRHVHQTAPHSCWFAVTQMIMEWAVRHGNDRARESAALDASMQQVFTGQTTALGEQARGGIGFDALTQPQMLQDMSLQAINPWERTPAAWERYLTQHGPLMYPLLRNGSRRHTICIFGIRDADVLIDDPEGVDERSARAFPPLSQLLETYPPVPAMPLLHAIH